MNRLRPDMDQRARDLKALWPTFSVEHGKHNSIVTREFKAMQQDHPSFVGVVDDDPAVLDSFRFMLEVAGYRVATFGSASDFLENASEPPACLILDQYMPDLTGLQLVEHLRSVGSTMPILLITGLPSPEIIVRAAELGIEGVIEKPPDEADILSFATAHL